MPPSIGSHIKHHGHTLIVGQGGRLYAPRTSMDAWGRTQHTQKVTKYRIVACGCGHAFIAHDGRIQRCPTCRTQRQQERYGRRFIKAKQPLTSFCDQPLTAQRGTKRYCSRACQQQAYRNRHAPMTEALKDRSRAHR